MVQLEVGKFYRDRVGNKVGPIVEYQQMGPILNHPHSTTDTFGYSVDGTFLGNPRREQYDIVAEWVVAFKTGDVVRLNSGGVKMTVRNADASTVAVEWLSDTGTPYRADYAPEMLDNA